MRNNSWVALIIVFGVIAIALFSSANVSFTTMATPNGDNPEATVGDTLNFVAGANMTITGDAGTDTITFTAATTGSGSQNLFETIATTSGTSPVADTATDTLTLTAGTGITVTGDAGTDTVTIDSTVVDTDTNANTICTGTTTYLDGDGGCDTLDGVEDFETATDDAVIIGNGSTFDTKVIPDCDAVNRYRLQYDTTTNVISCDTDTFFSSDIADNTILEADLKVVDSPVDEECLTFEATAGDFEWQTCGGAAGNSFETMNTPLGTAPVADSSTDTLNWTSINATIAISGSATTDNIDLDAVAVNCTGCITSANFSDNALNLADVYYGNTLAGNPAFLADECYFTVVGGSGGGFICEGSTVNGNEQLYLFPDVDDADTTSYIITSGDTGTVTTTIIANDTVLPADINYTSTLASNPGLAADECFWSVTATGGGFICEGSAANTNEQLYLFPDVDGIDTTRNIVTNNGEVTAVDGRSLTVGAGTLNADAELYTDTHTLWFENPTAADDLQTIWAAVSNSYTITAITCESDQTVNFDLQIDDGTPAGVNGSDIACTTFATDSSLAGDTGLDAGERLDLAITSVSGTPTWVSISWTVTKND
jgi:hypothetical protein